MSTRSPTRSIPSALALLVCLIVGALASSGGAAGRPDPAPVPTVAAAEALDRSAALDRIGASGPERWDGVGSGGPEAPEADRLGAHAPGAGDGGDGPDLWCPGGDAPLSVATAALRPVAAGSASKGAEAPVPRRPPRA